MENRGISKKLRTNCRIDDHRPNQYTPFYMLNRNSRKLIRYAVLILLGVIAVDNVYEMVHLATVPHILDLKTNLYIHALSSSKHSVVGNSIDGTDKQILDNVSHSHMASLFQRSRVLFTPTVILRIIFPPNQEGVGVFYFQKFSLCSLIPVYMTARKHSPPLSFQ